MLTLSPLNPADFDLYARDIFSILWHNMNTIDPSGCSFDEDFTLWYDYNRSNTQRKTILFINNETDLIAGFFQYRLDADTLWLDEIESLPNYQGKGLIYRPLMKYLLPQLPEQIRWYKSYVNKNNTRSASILEKMGCQPFGETASGKSLCYQGSITNLTQWVYQK